MRCPEGKGANVEERFCYSHLRKRVSVQKDKSDTAAVDNDHADAKTGSLLSGKCTTNKSIGAQTYKNTGKVNSQKAMLLRDTGADQTLVQGRYVPESAFTGTFVDLTLPDGSARQIPIATVRLHSEGI